MHIAYKNQYLILPEAVETEPLSALQQGAFERTAFEGLNIFTCAPLKVRVRKGGQSAVAVIGIVYDPLRPLLNEEHILEDILKTCRDFKAFCAYSDRLSGRFVLLYKDMQHFAVKGDACHLRQIFYGKIKESCFLTSAPKLALLALGVERQTHAEKAAFLESQAYARNRYTLYGNQSEDDRIFKLLPNHFFDMSAGEAARLPVCPVEALSRSETLDYAAHALEGSYEALAGRYKLLQPVTAGWDSRLLLAASHGHREAISHYVFMQTDKENPDIWVSQNLADALGFKLDIVERKALREDFIHAYGEKLLCPHIFYNSWEIQHHFDQGYGGNVVNINGNGAEIARCFYGYTSGKAGLDMLLHLSGYGRDSAFIAGEVESWLRDARPYALTAGLDMLDLFYWEQRMGNWGSVNPFLQDIAIEEISPFNNRRLLLTLLGIPAEERRAPHYSFFRALAAHMEARVLLEPVNPGESALKKMIKGNARLLYVMQKARGAVRRMRRARRG